MDSIDKWLKSLRLHKYSHLFKSLTYEQMLNIDEKYLIDLDITKGARNKILVSVRKLNLRPERLINMNDDLKRNIISMKEALNVLKEILVTPIPHPYEESRSKLSASCSPASLSSSTATSESDYVIVTSPSSIRSDSSSASSTSSKSSSSSMSPSLTPNILLHHSNSSHSTTPSTAVYSDPHDLTNLFVDTFEGLARHLIESGLNEDSSCHVMMAEIVDECLKHNSFTGEQKAKLARHKQCLLLEQRAKLARNRFHQQQQQQQQRQQLYLLNREQKVRSAATAAAAATAGFNKYQHQPYNMSRQQQHHGLYTNHHHHNDHQNLRAAQVYHNHHHYYQKPQQPQFQESLTSSLDDSNYNNNIQSNQFHHLLLQQQQQQQDLNLQRQQQKLLQQQQQHAPILTVAYGEYSLLGPGKTFELPCLRAQAERSSRND